MSKRLQVLLPEKELADIRRAARRSGVTTAEWVRRALRAARRSGSAQDPARKLAVIRAAVAHSFPVGDIDTMLDEIQRGYVDDRSS